MNKGANYLVGAKWAYGKVQGAQGRELFTDIGHRETYTDLQVNGSVSCEVL